MAKELRSSVIWLAIQVKPLTCSAAIISAAVNVAGLAGVTGVGLSPPPQAASDPATIHHRCQMGKNKTVYSVHHDLPPPPLWWPGD